MPITETILDGQPPFDAFERVYNMPASETDQSSNSQAPSSDVISCNSDDSTYTFPLQHKGVDETVLTEESEFQKTEISRLHEFVDIECPERWRDADRGWSWIIMVACFGGHTICTGLLYSTGLIHIALLKKFREDDAKTTWASAVFIAMMSFAGPLSSSLADRFGCRIAVVVSGVVFSSGFLLSAFAPNLETSIFSIGILAGSGSGMAYTILFTVNAYNFREKLNIAQGLSVSGSGFGILIMPPLIQLVHTTYGNSGLMMVLAGVVLQLVVLGTLMRPSRIELQTIRRRRQESKLRTTKKAMTCQTFSVFANVLSKKATICLSISMLLFCGGLYSVTLQLPNYAQINGFSPMQSAFFLSIIGVVSMISRVITGMLAQHPRISEIWIYSGSIGVLALVTFFFPAIGHVYAGHVFYSVCVGVFGGCCYVVINTINRDYVGVRYTAAACAVEFWFAGVGSIVVPVVSGYILSLFGDHSHVFILGAFCVLLSAITGAVPAFLQRDPVDVGFEIEIQENGHKELKQHLAEHEPLKPL